MKNLAIIPARGGSKRIPRKNIKDFLGKPIIAYSIEAALKSGLFDEVMVSTDDEEIAEVAKKYGANVPFLRTNKNSGDHSTLSDVFVEVLNNYLEQKIQVERFFGILPTAPTLTASHLVESNHLLSNGADSVISVVEFPFPIQRSLHIEDGLIYKNREDLYPKRSQDLTTYFHDAGQFYGTDTKRYLIEKSFFNGKTKGYRLDRRYHQDIDDFDDWKIAEIKYTAFLGETN